MPHGTPATVDDLRAHGGSLVPGATMVDRQLAALRAVLEERRREVVGELERLHAGAGEQVATIGFGKRAGDATAAATDRLHATVLASRLEEALSQIDEALDRLAAGTFGTCARCGAPIPSERLQAQPAATSCVGCDVRAPSRLARKAR